ncbi:hypothetical protein [Halostagnicola kamekurae]|uniref:Uncharacterized protein n=1 Tax=Halostagnicola kamekurae TaxID=619731 RepID=A0A1I6P0Z5_9EURY|nr:hypothetical protein [Halostagnicola kamekurae]SFS33851.1 hypothetical protein SAMN04488556_0254 [Halostagnicola kamekurae]
MLIATERHRSSEGTNGSNEGGSPSSRLLRWLLLCSTPVLLGVALWLHPAAGENTYESLAAVADTWYFIHVLLLPLFGLLGVCLYVMLDGYDGPVATIGRAGAAIYLTFYTGFEAIAGIAAGILIRETQSLPHAQRDGVATAVETMVSDPIVGGAALVGTVGSIVAVAAIAVCYRRSGAPIVPLSLLAGVPVTAVAHGEGYADVFGMALFLVAVVWLEFGWRRVGDRPSPQSA